MKNLPHIKTNIVLTEDIQNDIRMIFSNYIGRPLTKQLTLKIQNEIENLLVDKNYDKEKIFFTLDFNQ